MLIRTARVIMISSRATTSGKRMKNRCVFIMTFKAFSQLFCVSVKSQSQLVNKMFVTCVSKRYYLNILVQYLKRAQTCNKFLMS